MDIRTSPDATFVDVAPKPTLRTREAFVLGIGIVVGAGIFRTPSLVAGASSSDLVFLAAWVVGGVLSIIGAICYAELASTSPQAGGDYSYLKRAFGTRVAFLYDLGSGDGRIPIAAAKAHGVRGTGTGIDIDIDPQRIREANQNAKEANVTGLPTFKQEGLFQTDFSDATVVMLYLLDSLNGKLRPKLLAELEPGTRTLSHAFTMGDREPEQTVNVGPRTIYRWTVPERK